MAIKQPSHFLFAFLFVILSFSRSVYSDDEENQLLEGLNSHRASVNLEAFTKIKNAECVAKAIADGMAHDDHKPPCTNPTSSPGNNRTGLADFPEAVSTCHVDVSTSENVIVLPACVPKVVPTLVLTNFTRTDYARFLNDSTYTGIGISSENDWMVVVLTSDTPTGKLASGAYTLVNEMLGLSYYIVFLLLGFVFTCL